MKKEIRYLIAQIFPTDNSKRYWRDEVTGFISGMKGAAHFHTRIVVEDTVINHIKEPGIFQIEKVFINE